MKICSKCGVSKDESEFYNRADQKDGKAPACKACVHIPRPPIWEISFIKTCTKCGLLKDEEEFYKKRKDGLPQSWCKPCIKSDSAARNSANPEIKREQKRLRKQNLTPEEVKKRREQSSADYETLKQSPQKFKEKMERDHFWRVKRTHGLTKEQYLSMLADQGGVCAICYAPPSEGHHLCVDHEHLSGQVRGLLCKYCNLALGNIKDSLVAAQSLVRYISKYSKSSALPENSRPDPVPPILMSGTLPTS